MSLELRCISDCVVFHSSRCCWKDGDMGILKLKPHFSSKCLLCCFVVLQSTKKDSSYRKKTLWKHLRCCFVVFQISRLEEYLYSVRYTIVQQFSCAPAKSRHSRFLVFSLSTFVKSDCTSVTQSRTMPCHHIYIYIYVCVRYVIKVAMM